MPHGIRTDKKPVKHFAKDRVNPYTARILKRTSEARREDSLKHAVTHRDLEALELYEEFD